MSNAEYLTMAEAANILGKSRGYIETLIKKGKVRTREAVCKSNRAKMTLVCVDDLNEEQAEVYDPIRELVKRGMSLANRGDLRASKSQG